ncbi:MAG: excinuclease ABC subunit UvrA [Polyangiaceae bacterium]
MAKHEGPSNDRRGREPDFVEITGAREHNLDIPRLAIPKRKLVVFTGVSGSGKSSLAFDTLYAEGQRRYIETLSAYARQFLGQLERPNVEHLRGLSPTIAIEQKSASSNPRSTIGTITEVYDYLRVLFARAGVQHCTKCKKPVVSRTAGDVVLELLDLPEGTKLTISSPVVVLRKGEFKDLFRDLAARGFVRVRVDGKVHTLEDPPILDKKFKHTISIVVDRVVVRPNERARLAEAVELALREGKGELEAEIETPSAKGKPETRTFSESRTCCGIAYPALSPQSFSFNSPLGMCPSCNGLGRTEEVDASLVIADPELSMRAGAIAPWAAAMERGEGWTFRIADGVAKACGVNLDTPWKKLAKSKQDAVLFGIAGKKIAIAWGNQTSDSHGIYGMRWEGVIPNLMRRFRDTSSDAAREHYRRFMRERACPACDTKRLRPESLAVLVGGSSIADLTSMTIGEAQKHVGSLRLTKAQATIAEGAVREITSRLGFLLNVGLDYLSLDRGGPTLSGGEAQRIRLASQLGSELSGVMYVLDEPSIGLHQKDNAQLVATLERLRDLGNTVVVVEHDEDTIAAADWVVDFGPGAGHTGGKVVFEGTPAALRASKTSLTGAYLSGRERIEVPAERRTPSGALEIRGAREHNLQDVDVTIPLGVFVAVTGVSGAGKSSLVGRILLPALAQKLHGSLDPVGAHRSLKGLDALDKVIAIDQKPIGRTPRSNPGTYTKAFDAIREVFAQLPDARTRGFNAGRFSFNVKGGRCEACSGDGVVKVEMHFLSDVWVPCEVCGTKRYNQATLEVRYKGKSIADILDTSVEECLALFSSFPALRRTLETLVSVGLGYMKIGQPATTLSGGEAQRVKLSRELGKTQTGRTLYVLDEPTTGLHFDDIKKLLGVLSRLVDAGNSIVVIEHNLDVIKCADWVVDLGPLGGKRGGRIVAQGTPETVAKTTGSHTGEFLAKLLDAPRSAETTRRARASSPSRQPSLD